MNSTNTFDLLGEIAIGGYQQFTNTDSKIPGTILLAERGHKHFLAGLILPQIMIALISAAKRDPR